MSRNSNIMLTIDQVLQLRNEILDDRSWYPFPALKKAMSLGLEVSTQDEVNGIDPLITVAETETEVRNTPKIRTRTRKQQQGRQRRRRRAVIPKIRSRKRRQQQGRQRRVRGRRAVIPRKKANAIGQVRCTFYRSNEGSAGAIANMKCGDVGNRILRNDLFMRKRDSVNKESLSVDQKTLERLVRALAWT